MEGAFLHGKMKNLVMIEVGGKCAEVIISMHPDIYGNKTYKRKLYLKLERALHGNIEASKIWFDTFTAMLIAKGFKENRRDPCVLNKDIYGKHVTTYVYIYDKKSRSQGCRLHHRHPKLIWNMLKRMFTKRVT